MSTMSYQPLDLHKRLMHTIELGVFLLLTLVALNVIYRLSPLSTMSLTDEPVTAPIPPAAALK